MAKLDKGLQTDFRPINQSLGSWRDARNILINRGYRSITNEDGIIPHLTPSAENPDLPIIGVIPLSEGAVLFSTDSTTSEIGIVDVNGVYTKKIRSIYLGFNLNAPIEGVFKFNFKENLIIAFWNGTGNDSTRPFLINLDDIPVGLLPNLELSNSLEIEKLYLFPQIKVPSIELNRVDEGGGSVEEGVHYFTIAYRVGNFDRTKYVKPSRPVYIADIKEQSIGQEKDELGNEGYPYPRIFREENSAKIVSRVIHLNITNLDTIFDTIILVDVFKQGGTLSAKEVGEFKIESGGTASVYYDGNFVKTLTAEEVTVNEATYNRIKTGTEIKDRLAVANFTTKQDFNYQKYANNIKVEWDYIDLPVLFGNQPNVPAGNEVTNKRGINMRSDNWFDQPEEISLYRGFMPSEVYGLYITWIYLDGTYTRAFHIPGRRAQDLGAIVPALAGELENDLNDGTTVDALDDTCRYFHTVDTSRTAPNEMGYWENEDEFYANSSDFEVWDVDGTGTGSQIDSIVGEKIRHHKFPDINTLHNTNVPNEILGKQLGLKLKDIKLPNDLKGQVQGFFISYAARGSEDRTAVGNSLTLRNNWYFTLQNTDQPSRFYAFDLLSQKPSLNIRFLKFLYNGADGTGNNVGDGPTRLKTLNTSRTDIIPVTNPSYVPEDNSAVNPTNANREEFIAVNTGDIGGRIGIGALGSGPKIYSAHSYIKNIFTPYYNQDLVSTGKIYYNTGNFEYDTNAIDGLLFGGDTFAQGITTFFEKDNPNDHTSSELLLPLIAVPDLQTMHVSGDQTDYFKTHLNVTGNGVNDGFYTIASVSYDPNSNITVVVVVEPRVNVAVAGELRLFYPTTVDVWKADQTPPAVAGLGIVVGTYMGYNTLNFSYKDKPSYSARYSSYKYTSLDFASVSNLKKSFPFNPFIVNVNNRRYSIARSIPFTEESATIGWRTFKVNEVFEMEKNKGEVWKLATLNRSLIIQQEYALFKAATKDQLETENIDIVLGVGDIFDRDPDEIIPEDSGYVGSNSQFASFVCKLGYVTFDQTRGKAFIYSGEGFPREISANGQRNFFIENLELTNKEIDNPFNGNGLTAAYDEINDRLIIAKVEEQKPFTLSYSNILNQGRGGWICFHDWLPSHLYFNRKNLYSIKNINALPLYTVFEHSDRLTRGLSYSNTESAVYNKSYIDAVLNFKNLSSKKWQDISWNSEALALTPEKQTIQDKTITQIMVYSGEQCSGIISLEDLSTWFNKNKRDVEDTWRFNKFRDIVIDPSLPYLDEFNQVIQSNLNNSKKWFDKSKFITKFVIVRMQIDNIEQYELHINDVGAIFVPSNR